MRLYKGDYDKKTVYSKNPLEIAQKFEQMGAKYLHLVDLDGAKLGQTRNLEIVRKIKDQTNLKIEIGGGIRNLDTVSLYLEQIGVERVILGSAAAEKPDFLKELLVKYGLSRIVVGVDIREGFVSTSGWLEKTTLPYLSFLKDLADIMEEKEFTQSKDLHDEMYEILEKYELKPQKGFQAIYKMILGKKQGPRAASFLLTLDKDFVIKRLRQEA